MMTNRFDLVSVLIFIGLVQAILLAAALILKKRHHRPANTILAAFLLLLASFQILVFLYHTARINSFPHLIRTETPLLFLVGPLLLFYLQAVTTNCFQIGRKEMLHFLPFVACVFYLAPFYLSGESLKISLVYFMQSKESAAWHAEITLAMLHLLFYMAIVAQKLQRHSGEVKNVYSTVRKINLSWLWNLLVAIGCIWLALIFHYNYPLPLCNVIFSSLITVVVVYVGFKGLTQPEIFAIAGAAATLDKYATSALTAKSAEVGLARLQQFMTEEKPFLQADFSLPILAKALAMSPHHLSQIINERLHYNFFEFSNRYRIEEAKQLLDDAKSANSTISNIANEVGFNSISAFNTAFRRFTGTTPSVYRKRHA